MGYTPQLNIPNRKRKGLIKLYGGLSDPFFYTADAVVEGQPMKPATADAAATVQDSQKVTVAGATDGASVIGLSLQITYDDALTGQLAQLKNYHFANDTAQRLDGMPIGILTGQGHAFLENYAGAVVAGEQMAVGASGLLEGATTAGSGNDALVPIWVESAGTAPAPIRIRFDLPFSA